MYELEWDDALNECTEAWHAVGLTKAFIRSRPTASRGLRLRRPSSGINGSDAAFMCLSCNRRLPQPQCAGRVVSDLSTS